MTDTRKSARAFGLHAESVAAVWLRLKRYEIIERNFLARGGEIDIVAQRGCSSSLSRSRRGPAMEMAQRVAIDNFKIARISRAARYWLARNRWAADLVFRGDAIFIAPFRPPLHVSDAFALDLFR